MHTPRSRGFIIPFLAFSLIAIVGGLLAVSYYRQNLARNLSIASQRRADVSITIVEGWRREQIAQQLEKLGICSTSDFLAASANYEGTLYPDTYRFFPNTPASEVVAKLRANFQARMDAAGISPTQDQLILASIVEREAASASEAPAIAGVYANRMAISMKLDADPTVIYGRDNLNATTLDQITTFTYWKKLEGSLYTIISPYNTYLQAGLPPGPIANPSLNSIKAAINPASSPYFYFLHRDGVLYLSKTLAEHVQRQR